jgi:hypothetical protein
VEEAHSNWSVQEIQAVKQGQLWKGMSLEQFECVVGQEAYHRHWHISPSGGEETAEYSIYVFWVSGSYGYTTYFNKNGRLQIF